MHVLKPKAPKKQGKKCSNCNTSLHTVKTCWAKGGGAEGKAPDWWKEKQQSSLRLGSKQKESMHIASDNRSDDSHVETNVAIDSATKRFTDWDTSCLSIDTAVDTWSGSWSADNTCPMLINNSISPMSHNKRALVTHNNAPFAIDSGCTSHCSPACADFLELQPIESCQVCGMSGSSIPAVGRGIIVLKCGKGRKLTLRDVLYVPQAAIRLILVGQLANDGLNTTFDQACCFIKNKSGKMIADGTINGTGLYYVNGKAPLILKDANLARAVPNLLTWHHCLGHVNF